MSINEIRNYQKDYKTAKKYVLGAIVAWGPVSFKACQHELKTQHTDLWEDYEVVKMINELIKEGLIELWEDGESFNVPCKQRKDLL